MPALRVAGQKKTPRFTLKQMPFPLWASFRRKNGISMPKTIEMGRFNGTRKFSGRNSLCATCCLQLLGFIAALAASGAGQRRTDQDGGEPEGLGDARRATTPTRAIRSSTRSTRRNVGKLQVAWTFSTGVLRGHEGGPLIIGNMMYVHTPFPNKVYALDLSKDKQIVWKYEPKQDPNVIPVMCCDTVNRGVAYGDGKIFLHQADTTLVALDAKTGKVEWSAKNGDPGKGETGTRPRWWSRTRF